MVSVPKFLNFGLHEQPRSILGLSKRKTFSMQAFKGFGPGLLSRIDVRGLVSTSNETFSARRSGRSKIRSGSEFVARHIGEMEGVILEAETGDFLGKHRGFWFYTIGQRQGLRLSGGPCHNGNFPSTHRILNRYVVEKDAKNNVVFVSRNYYSFGKRRRLFRVGSLKWLSGSPPSLMNQLQCKVVA
ncbi:hypothetical protein TEA_014734 [Camellia sinensis var. sinensis]|uniref:tRNA-specific 2-thiouridylase MnmA-like central domain-containing protein n=1 Tax=Camellia sinensis var. sinensis TaxID=542762 RepID=A0A4S4EN52_CAMSN|nr:hypothetical protein TEA_014734 [Camellia sinensis var. sinensis]